jgi:hypothetical protein
MCTEVPKLKGLSNSRFGSIIFLLRMAGIPFKMKQISTTYALYMITVIICSCSTFIGMFVDVYIHRDELGRAMTNLRVSIPYTNLLFLYFYCRYVATLVITIYASESSVSIPPLHTLMKKKILNMKELQKLCHKKRLFLCFNTIIFFIYFQLNISFKNYSHYQAVHKIQKGKIYNCFGGYGRRTLQTK